MSLVSRKILSESELRTIAPAVFASSPDSNVSSKYVFVPTYKIMENLKKVGWHPVFARMNKSKEFSAKHLIRFAPKSMDLQVGDIFPEIVVINSHDRSYALNINIGLFRLACSNGLVVADSTFAEMLQKHININFEDVERLTGEVVHQFNILTDKIKEYKTIELTEVEKGKFAQVVKEIHWSADSVIEPKSLLVPRRLEDGRNDLWSVFNVLQENIIKGGISYIGKNEEGQERKRRTKALKNLERDFKINQNLWMIMAAFAANRSF
jgi:hypothetical protein